MGTGTGSATKEIHVRIPECTKTLREDATAESSPSSSISLVSTTLFTFILEAFLQITTQPSVASDDLNPPPSNIAIAPVHIEADHALSLLDAKRIRALSSQA